MCCTVSDTNRLRKTVIHLPVLVQSKISSNQYKHIYKLIVNNS